MLIFINFCLSNIYIITNHTIHSLRLTDEIQNNKKFFFITQTFNYTENNDKSFNDNYNDTKDTNSQKLYRSIDYWSNSDWNLFSIGTSSMVSSVLYLFKSISLQDIPAP